MVHSGLSDGGDSRGTPPHPSIYSLMPRQQPYNVLVVAGLCWCVRWGTINSRIDEEQCTRIIIIKSNAAMAAYNCFIQLYTHTSGALLCIKYSACKM